jgi:AcrR family transcriptional regulator
VIDPTSGTAGTGSSLPRVPRPKVHDAALRLRLLECAGATLSTRGLAGLSLRTLAAEVGTSTTAVYALFGGKPALLEALHAEAFSRLAARLAATLDERVAGVDPVEDLVALGRAYREAALADPHFYDVMFGGVLPAGERWWSVASPLLAPVVERVERAAATGALRPGTEPTTVSLALWATVHGLVSLHLRGLRPPEGPAPEQVFELALRAAVAGWLCAPRAVARA